MPELPEMETYRKMLGERIVGRTISDAEVNRDKTINVPAAQFVAELKGNSVTRVERRAKHLIFRLKSGSSLLLHLMLGGWMYLGDDNDNPDRTKQVILSFGEMKLYFIGLRLGFLHLHDEQSLNVELDDLGPEPLDPAFTIGKFKELFSGRKGMIKTTLVNQKVIAGIGNCYSDEICHEAGIKPVRTFAELEPPELNSMYHAMKTVFLRAIEAGGYMDQPLFKDDMKTGGYDKQCRVYDREGEACIRCGNLIIKEIVSSRKTFYCPDCQH
ncbi:formamidopyrimidine-DNA glycosylase [Mesobacillus campisalis]|uniref:Formamidopyrimidine-DNA glycosylase n=1 Tax=Mesobacillus campisalis TaxID=1408103 RepID=A0A0M2SPY7_9BACI|nr:bifunctional DNA-formamidopyrimidine glycosylase/DNA-(apurinic or apyrimidinic site) lyase [Mesobacillus campisalis]KKK36604.1 formamidopyrimidine-DNA glycosylase [Mesobacillus campisalis]